MSFYHIPGRHSFCSTVLHNVQTRNSKLRHVCAPLSTMPYCLSKYLRADLHYVGKLMQQWLPGMYNEHKQNLNCKIDLENLN